MACSSIKCFNDAITTIKSLAILEKELERKTFNVFRDIECGNSAMGLWSNERNFILTMLSAIVRASIRAL